jgi:hypothetical protein
MWEEAVVTPQQFAQGIQGQHQTPTQHNVFHLSVPHGALAFCHTPLYVSGELSNLAISTAASHRHPRVTEARWTVYVSADTLRTLRAAPEDDRGIPDNLHDPAKLHVLARLTVARHAIPAPPPVEVRWSLSHLPPPACARCCTARRKPVLATATAPITLQVIAGIGFGAHTRRR